MGSKARAAMTCGNYGVASERALPPPNAKRPALGSAGQIEVERLRRLLKVIHFRDGDTHPAIFAGYDRGVLAGRQSGDESGLEIILRCHVISCQFSSLDRIILPVIVSDEEHAIAVTKLKGRISQEIRNVSEGGPNRANDDFFASSSVSEDKPGDHDIVAGLDKAARADVSELRIGGQVEIVHFDDANAGSAILSVQDRRVIGGWQSRDDRGFQVVGRRERAGLNLSLLGVFPIIVAEDE